MSNDSEFCHHFKKMRYTSNSNLTNNARALRKNMTKEERKLWYEFFKLLPYSVHRQYVIGNYIVDFYCASAKLVIELDGAQHYEEDAERYDAERDEFLRSKGLTVLRYSNIELNHNFKGVCEDILNHMEQQGSS